MSSAFRLSRRRLVVFAVSVLASPALAENWSGLSADDQALVERARTYLLGLTNAMGRFTQTDPHGHVTNGTLYLRRPGRARFEYDPPSGLILASNGFRVAILNKQLGTLDAYPLAATPLGVLLSRDIRIDKNVEISTVRRRPGGFSINAGRTSKRREGEIALDFSLTPVALTGWSITDIQGGVTTVALSDFAPSKAWPNAFFELSPTTAPANPPGN
ncbi:MAG TPA: outer-membrane lipoprotein carrier protein LolA [Caulobacteraceae bacterium]